MGHVHTVGKPQMSTFQRHKVCMNRSLDENVMAPGSRGVGAIFSHFSGEDSGQTGEATGEPRVASCSWSCSLSYALGLTNQLVSSRKGIRARRRSRRRFSTFLVPLESLRYPSSLEVLDLRATELGLKRYGPANRGHRSVFGSPEGIFPIEIPTRPGKILAIRELHVVSKHVLFLTHLSSRIKLAVSRKELCARARHPRGENYEIFSMVLFLLPVFARVVDVAPDVRFRRSWCRQKAYSTFFLKILGLRTEASFGFARCGPVNRGCRSVFHAEGSFSDRDFRLDRRGALDDPRVVRGGGQPNPAFGLVNTSVKPWSNLVNPNQTWSNLPKLRENVLWAYVLRVFEYSGPQSGQLGSV
uniref:Uncharacterized protein n=1 Tax=Fagus sylvatica TaxID=28930 RepID=A0A2N9J4K9_FAGSY